MILKVMHNNAVFILLFFLQLIDIYNSINQFKLRLVDENMKIGTYIRPILSENNYLYIVTGEDVETNSKFKRYIIKYNTKTASYVETITYQSDYDFSRGEPYILGNNYEYLFITTFCDWDGSKSSSEMFNVNIKSKNQNSDPSIHGYRRVFKKDGNYAYIGNLGFDNGVNILIKKMIINYSGNFPSFSQIEYNNEVKIKYQAMISCDLTKNRDNILCTYYSEELKVGLAVYSNSLGLLLNQKYEEVEFSDNNFIKILYLKDNSNFVLMNSQTESKARLRYFNYYNNQITHKLSSITKTGNDYLDLDDIQNGGHNANNDMITFGSDKIIKLHINFGDSSQSYIIITIIQFYDNDSSMSIKIYKMKNKEGFELFSQGRIELMKNFFLVCLSVTKGNDERRPGYFFINYPNSTDTNLGNTNNIKISDIISLENKLFSIELKLKILSIPTGFIFINSLNSEVIRINDELESNAQIIFRQYRINEGTYILKYQAIARGTDSGYMTIKKYPSYKTITDNIMFFEGRKGEIKINLNHCLSGYYKMENDNNLCTNLKPANYYADEINKIYKTCPYSCNECNTPINATFMNCINCQQNYYMTEDTRSCYQIGVNYYYLDKDTLRRCHHNCLKCPNKAINDTFMNCDSCENNYYITEDTKSCYNYVIDNYYLDSDKLRRCHPNCLKCSSSEKNESYMNCITCQQNYYMTEDTESCYNEIIDNYYLDNDTLRRCHPNCLKCNSIQLNESYMNCIVCQENYYITEDTKQCYKDTVNYYYRDGDILKRCHSNCLKCSSSPEDNIQNQIYDSITIDMKCTECKQNYYKLDGTNNCYDNTLEQEGFYLKDKIYYPCETNCLTCISGYFLFSNECKEDIIYTTSEIENIKISSTIEITNKIKMKTSNLFIFTLLKSLCFASSIDLKGIFLKISSNFFC